MTLGAVSVLAFLFLELAPGDYVDQMRLDPRISDETLDAMRVRYGLDRPIGARYLLWLNAVLDGSWGYSFAYGTAAAPLILERLGNTLLLAVVASGLAWAVALPVGVYWALRNNAWSPWLDLTTSVTLAVPELVLALAALVVAEASGMFPIGGMSSTGTSALPLAARAGDVAWHLLLPVAVLALPAASVLSRHVRAAVEQVSSEPHVARARASGISELRLVVHHLLRPAAGPLLALASLSVASLLSGSFIVEVIMGWPGLGPLLLDAIRARDVHVVIGGVMCSAVLVVGGRLMSDLALYLNDPRTALG